MLLLIGLFLLGCNAGSEPSGQTSNEAEPVVEDTSENEASSEVDAVSSMETEAKSDPIYVAGCILELTPVAAMMQQVVADLQLEGAALFLAKDGQVLCESYFGQYNENTVVPLVSSAKWISAAVILRLVDEGLLSLDDPISKYLDYFEGVSGTITMRQLLSHTSGLPAYHPCMFRVDIVLDQCVRAIAQSTLAFTPGTQFAYAGAPFSVAGRVAEVAAGKLWGDIFYEYFVEPMGMIRTYYGNTRNPILSEGYVVSSLQDYGRFLQMILDGGVYNGQQILSEAILEEMFADQTANAEIAFTPRGDDVSYGLGNWRDRSDEEGNLITASSAGGGGYLPWINFQRNVAGIFMVSTRDPAIWDKWGEMGQLIREGLDKLEAANE